MRGYVRLSPRWGASMPWWAALIVGACWLVVMLAIVFYGLIAMALVACVRVGRREWARRHPPG